MRLNYHVIEGKGKTAERALAKFCMANGQVLLPLVELIEQARLTISSVLDQVSQQTIEMLLELSAEQVAGPRTPGKASCEIRWHGSQAGRVSLDDRPLEGIVHTAAVAQNPQDSANPNSRLPNTGASLWRTKRGGT